MVFDVQVSEHDGATVLALVGELDLASAPKVRQAVVQALGTPTAGAAGRAPAGLVVDLRGVDFIDSTGLGVLIGARRRTRAARGELRVVVADPRMLELFRETDLDRVFALYPTLDDAVRASASVPVTGGRDA